MLSILRSGMSSFWKEEDGIGTLEMILIIVVILIIALFFKDELLKLVKRLFSTINSKSDEFIK